jgi:hypothetical protein
MLNYGLSNATIEPFNHAFTHFKKVKEEQNNSNEHP